MEHIDLLDILNIVVRHNISMFLKKEEDILVLMIK